jgi:hypothetical protein
VRQPDRDTQHDAAGDRQDRRAGHRTRLPSADRGWTQNYLMEPGDTLQFEGDIRYGPARLARLPIRFLPVTVFSRAGG